MNKIFNYMKIKIAQKKYIYIEIIILVMFIFLQFIQFSKATFYQPNWYDLIMSIFSSQLNISYFLFVIFILFIYSLSNNKNFDRYIFLKFSSRKKWYNYNILTMLVFSITFTFFIIIQCFLEGVLTLNFTNEWSQNSLMLSSNTPLIVVYEPNVFKYIINTISPITYIIINIFFIICYFFVIGMIYFLISICCKNKIWIFMGIFLVNCINIAAYRSGYYIMKKYSFYHNIILVTNNNGDLNNSIFYNRFYYWITLIFIIYIIGYFITSKKDFYFGDSL